MFTVRPFSKIDAAFFHFSIFIISIFRFRNKLSLHWREKMSEANILALFLHLTDWPLINKVFIMYPVWSVNSFSSSSSIIQNLNVFWILYLFLYRNRLASKVLVWFTWYWSFQISFEQFQRRLVSSNFEIFKHFKGDYLFTNSH